MNMYFVFTGQITFSEIQTFFTLSHIQAFCTTCTVDLVIFENYYYYSVTKHAKEK